MVLDTGIRSETCISNKRTLE